MKYKGILLGILFFTFYNITSFSEISRNTETVRDSLNRAIKDSEHDTSIARAYVTLSEQYAISDKDTMVALCNKAIELVDKNLKRTDLLTVEKRSFLFTYGTALNNIGSAAYYEGDILSSLDYHLKALKIFENEGKEKDVADLCNNLGFIYRNVSDTASSLKYYRKSLSIRKKIADSLGIAQSMSNIGVLYNKKKETEKALEYFEKSLAISTSLGNKRLEASTLGSIAAIAVDNKNYSKALPIFQNNLEVFRGLNDKKGVCKCFVEIGNIKLKMGNWREAIPDVNKGLELAEELGYPAYLAEAANLKHLVIESEIESSGLSDKQRFLLGKEAMKWHDIYIRNSLLIRNTDLEKEMIRREAQYNYEKQKAELEVAHQKQLLIEKERAERQKLYAVFAVLTILLLVIIGLYIYRLERQKKRMIKLRLETTKLKKERLEMDLEMKNKELTSITLRIDQNNQFIAKLDKLMSNMYNQSKEELNTRIQDLKKEIKLNRNEEKYLTSFQERFDSVHKDFIKNLKTTYPKLTANEIRICTLLKMNMSSADMAGILGVSSGSLKMYRHRISTKMDLPKGTVLSDFIIQLS